MEEFISCQLCTAASHLKFSRIKEYIQHIKLYHAHQPDFRITCGVREHIPINPGIFINHVYAIHGEEINEVSVNVSLEDNANDNENYNLCVDDDDDYNDDDNDVFTEPDVGVNQSQKSSAIFLLGLKRNSSSHK